METSVSFSSLLIFRTRDGFIRREEEHICRGFGLFGPVSPPFRLKLCLHFLLTHKTLLFSSFSHILYSIFINLLYNASLILPLYISLNHHVPLAPIHKPQPHADEFFYRCSFWPVLCDKNRVKINPPLFFVIALASLI
ncbi:uncharacterized protein DS421_5g138220 [Arachis hypogaea]|nr:uncharacterized protein DS421_5g138220 [Arachis hypogaea]